MVYFPVLGSTLLRTQRLILPRSFCRSKSITAAIERGRQSRPDRAPRPRTRGQSDNVEKEVVKTRREKRFELFGPPRNGGDALSKPRNERQREKVTKPRDGRSSRASFIEHRDAFSRDTDLRSLSNRDDSLPEPRRERRGEAVGRDRMNAKERAPYSGRGEARDRRERPFQERKTFMPERYKAASNLSETSSERNFTPRPARSERYSGRGDQSSSYPTRFRSDDQANRDGKSGARYGQIRPERNDSQDSSRKQSETPIEANSDTGAQQTSVRGPESLPYTTAASEFLYGYSSVLAAIKANRRKLYNLYIHSRGSHREGLLTSVRALKLFPIVNEVGEEYLRVMDKVSSGRPHNGIVLEASALPVPPITELKTASKENESFSVGVDTQSAEDLAVNGNEELYSYKSGGWRHPLILYVDGVLDEGNLGAIARSAYFLGVDAIVTPTRQTAPWSHVALKASAGAAEAIPVFKVVDPATFLGNSSRAGWRIYASGAVPSRPSSASTSKFEEGSKVAYAIARSNKELPAGHSPVREHPTILMMGGEGTGLRNSLQNLAHYKVGIPHRRDAEEIGVDSLNVSVAASLLCYEMLQRPKSPPVSNPDDVLF